MLQPQILKGFLKVCFMHRNKKKKHLSNTVESKKNGKLEILKVHF